MKQETPAEASFGDKDSSYIAAGKLDGIQQLVTCFYHVMGELPEAVHIRDMHPSDLTVSIDKLSCFLSGWLGGPKLYADKYGGFSIPQVHKHLAVTELERDAWLLCMFHALEMQPLYTEPFRKYMLHQLAIPAERIRLTCKGSQ
ncbi:MAG: hemoglobin [Polaribacter sp.]